MSFLFHSFLLFLIFFLFLFLGFNNGTLRESSKLLMNGFQLEKPRKTKDISTQHLHIKSLRSIFHRGCVCKKNQSTNLFLQLCQSVCPLLFRVRARAALTLLTVTAELTLRGRGRRGGRRRGARWCWGLIWHFSKAEFKHVL